MTTPEQPKPETPEEKSLFQKATTANIIAGLSVGAMVVYSFLNKDPNALLLAGGAGVGYLFGKSQS